MYSKCQEFLLYYQPIMDAREQTIRGAEALIRYQDEKHGLVFPDAFIPFLENDAIFTELGDWILKKTMEDGLEFVRRVPDFIMNVNLSYVQLEKSDFTDTVKKLLRETGFPAENLCLEITERCRLLDMKHLANIINDLRETGVRIAMDDFGTGFSSASVLDRLTFDTVKIDRVFVTNIDADRKKQEVLRHLIGLARTSGADVCVEGIENEQTREAVICYPVTSLQGYMNSDILYFFDGHMDALPIYEKLEGQILQRIPDARITVSKTQISFSLKHGFAFVSFTPCRKAAQRPSVWLTVTFGLGYRKQSPRIDIAVEPYPNRWTHHVMVGSVDEIDEELMSWICEAADFALHKGRN